MELGEKFQAEVILNLGTLTPEDIGVDLIFAKRGEDGQFQIRNVQELQQTANKKYQTVYTGEVTASMTGAFQYGIRFYPKNPFLNYRRDLPLVEWI